MISCSTVFPVMSNSRAACSWAVPNRVSVVIGAGRHYRGNVAAGCPQAPITPGTPGRMCRTTRTPPPRPSAPRALKCRSYMIPPYFRRIPPFNGFRRRLRMLRGDDSTRDCFAGCPGGELPGKPSRSNVFHTASLRPLLFRSLRAGREFHVNGAGAHSAEAFLSQDTRGNGIYYEIGALPRQARRGSRGEYTSRLAVPLPAGAASRRDRNSAPERLKQTRQIPCYPAVPGDNGG